MFASYVHFPVCSPSSIEPVFGVSNQAPYSRNGKSRPTCGLTCAHVLEYAVNSNESPRGTAGRLPPPLPPPPTHAHTIPVYDNVPQINVHLASFLADLSLASSNRLAAGSSLSRQASSSTSESSILTCAKQQICHMQLDVCRKLLNWTHE